MNRLPMSRAASALLRALMDRADEKRDRILLIEIQTQDWQSLTLTGERHRIDLSVSGAGAWAITESLTAGLQEAEFSIAGQIVADIAVTRGPAVGRGGKVTLSIEALTIAE